MNELISRVAADLGLEPQQAEELLRTLLRASREDLQGLRAAAEQADSASAAACVTRLAHHIKGAAGNLDIEDLRAAAQRLEVLATQGQVAAVEIEAVERALRKLAAALP